FHFVPYVSLNIKFTQIQVCNKVFCSKSQNFFDIKFHIFTNICQINLDNLRQNYILYSILRHGGGLLLIGTQND
ncbi:hypothetical protein IKS86_03830, partial [bacterium]|nr:hypothetical protein [bacterium]